MGHHTALKGLTATKGRKGGRKEVFPSPGERKNEVMEVGACPLN